MSATQKLLSFGVFELNLDTEELRKSGTVIKLPPQSLKLLGLLAGQAGQAVSREEIQKQLWGEETFVDFEHGVNKCIKQIRNALGDDADNPLYIETLPRHGYRFVAPVVSKTIAAPRPRVVESQSGESRAALSVGVPAQKSGSAATAITRSHPATVPVMDVTAVEEPQVARAVRPQRRARLLWIGVAVVLIALLAGGLYWRAKRAKANTLTEKDTIVLADFDNHTGDPVFDDTLKQALSVALRQSPFLNILSEGKVANTLELMTRPANTPLTADAAREVCERAESKAYIVGSIASLGTEYVLGLKAVNCQNGDILAQEQATADAKEKVLGALREAAAKLRGELGESLATVQKFDVALEQATTPSLDALKAYSLGVKTYHEKDPAAALPYFQRAIQLDPNFAMAYSDLGDAYASLYELGRARECYARAFELREHASELEKMRITAGYHQTVTGELDKAAEISQEQVASYPRDDRGYFTIGIVYGQQGRYEKAAEVTRKGLDLLPDDVGLHENLTWYLLALQRIDEAQQTIQQAKARKLDDFGLYQGGYALAFLRGDLQAMQEQAAWFANQPEYETFGHSLESDTAAFGGHLKEARKLTGQAVESARRVDGIEKAAVWQANAALREALFGNTEEARRAANEALRFAPACQGAEAEAALALAIAGDAVQADLLAQDLNRRYPLDTQIQTIWLPTIRAQLALGKKDPAEGIDRLQGAGPTELGNLLFAENISCLYPVYVRGEAFMAAGQGSAAAAEFQKILDHSGIVWNCSTGALARLGLARAYALQARTAHGPEADAAHTRAVTAYRDFLNLWKDADADIPMYKQAKSEYARLGSG